MSEKQTASPTTAEEYRDQQVRVKKLDLSRVEVPIESMPGSALLVHAWSEKARRMMLESQQGGRRKLREKRDPEQEFEQGRYRLSDETDGFPVIAIKAAMINAAHKDIGIPKNAVSKAVFLEGDEGQLVRILGADGKPYGKTRPPQMREDVGRIGGRTANLIFRPMYAPWRMNIQMIYDSDLIDAETVYNLVERAGFGVGIGDWRPEHGGDFGRFRVVSGG